MQAGTLEIEMVTNLVKLQQEMEQIKKAVGGMENDVARKVKSASDQFGKLGAGGGAQELEQQLARLKAANDDFVSAQERTRTATVETGEANQFASHHVQNLAFQFNDLAIQMVGAAQSSSPIKGMFMALFQQGSQISGVMAQAGVGVRGLASELLRLTGITVVTTDATLEAAAAQAAAHQAALAAVAQRTSGNVVATRAELALAQAALATATSADATAAAQLRLAAATAAATRAAQEAAVAQSALAGANTASAEASAAASAAQVTSLGRMGVIAGIGATALAALAVGVALVTDEVNKNTKVNVSWQNTVLGAYDVVRDYVGNQLTSAFATFGVTTGEVWQTVKAYTKNAVNFIIGATQAIPNLLAATWRLIPAAIGDAFYSAANLAIEGLNTLVRGAAGAVNGLVDVFNSVFGTSIPKAVFDGIDKIANPYAGAMAALGSAGAKSLTGSFKDYVGDIADAITGAAVKRQLAENAKKAGKAAGKELAKGIKEDSVDEVKKWLDLLGDEMAKLKEIANQLDFKAAPGFEQMILKNNEAFNKGAEAVRAYGESLRDLQDIAGELDFGTVFGDAGDAVMQMADTFDRLAAAQKAHGEALYRAGSDQAQINKVNAAYDKAKLNGTVALLGQTKRLFSEQSAGYKAVEAAEKAAAALAAVNTIKHVAAGAAKIFAQLGPWAFPVVGAMVAVMAGLGFSGGGGSSYTPPSAEDMQAGIGTGTVLGDSGAQSESIANALQIMADNSNADLEYSNDQVRYLREISAGIGDLTSQIARQVGLGAGGMFSTSGLNLGTSGSSGVLGLFGSSTTRSLYDQGIETFNQQIGQILAAGVEAQIYNVVQTVKQKSGFLGIGGGTSTSYTTTTGAIDNSVSRQFGLIIGDIQASITDMITGLAGNTNAAFRAEVEKYINNMVLPGTRLSFEGMSGDEIEKALNAYFSSVADTITMMVSGLAIPDLAAFQQAGEGLYETLARVTRTLATVSVALKSIGMGGLDGFGGDFSSTGRVTAATNLSDQFGGLDAMQEAIANFSETFLTEAERMAPVITSVRDEMARLGVAGVTTNDQFKALVQGLDLSTASGQSMFAQLLAVAPAFAKVTEYLGDLNGELVETGKTAAQLAQIEKDRRALSIQIMELTGDAEGALAAKRADQLASLDESLRPLQEHVFALQDQKAASEAAAQAAAELAAAEQRVANERGNLETRLLQLQGDTVALRERELAALDPSNRALLLQIFAIEDATAAAQALAEAQAEAARIAEAAAAEQQRLAEEAAALAARIADERSGLETRLLQLQGDTVALRERELAALDPSNRALLLQIFAIEDATAAAQALAEAQAEAARIAEAAAAEQQRLAEEAAALAARIADERFGLETRLLQLQGNTVALRERELAALDPSNRALLLQIFAIEDATAAAQALAEAQAEATRIAEAAAAEQQRLAEEAAALAARIADERFGLETRLLQLQGDTVALRERELAALDPSNRALLLQIYALEDAQAAQEAYADAVASARDNLSTAYEREAGALRDTIDRFAEFGRTLRDFRSGLFSADAATANSYRQLQVDFIRTSALAATGDTAAMGGLAGSGSAFLEASKAQASSLVQYQRDVAFVARSVDTAIGAADAAVDYAQLQLTALERLVGGYIDLNENTLSVAQAIAQLQEAQADEVVPATVTPIVDAQEQQTQAIRDTNARLEQRIMDLESTLSTFLGAAVDKLHSIDRREQKYDRGDFKAIGNDSDTPVTTVTA